MKKFQKIGFPNIKYLSFILILTILFLGGYTSQGAGVKTTTSGPIAICNGATTPITVVINGAGNTQWPITVNYEEGGVAKTFIVTDCGTGTCSYIINVSETFELFDADGNDGSNIGAGGTTVVTVTNTLGPNVALTPDPAFCGPGGTFGLTAVTAGGTTPYVDYTWAGHASVVGSTGGTNTTSFDDGPMPGNPGTSANVSVTVTDTDGCVASDNLTINIIDLQVDILSPLDGATQCVGTAFSLDGWTSGGSGSPTYSWTHSGGTGSFSDAATEDPTFTATSASAYTIRLTVTDLGVSVWKEITVNTLALPLDRGISVINYCDPIKGSLTVHNSEAGVDYHLYNSVPAFMGTITGTGGDIIWDQVLDPEDYNVVAENAVGCTFNLSGTYTILPKVQLSATASAPVTICEGTSTTLDVNTDNVNGSGTTTYLWSDPNPVSLNSTAIKQPVASPIVTSTYNVTITDEFGCYNTDNLTVTVDQAPNISINASSIEICDGETVTLSSPSTGEALFYSWNGAALSAGSVDPIPDEIVTPASIPITIYTLYAEDASGCNTTVTQDITVNSVPTANAGIDVAECQNVAVSLTATGSGGTVAGAYQYAWDNGALIQSTAVSTASAGVTTYTVTVTDDNSCFDTDDVIVTVEETPTAILSGSGTICEGAAGIDLTATLTGTANFSLSVFDGSSTTLHNAIAGSPYTFNVNPNVTTTYEITNVSHAANACTNIGNSVTVTVDPLPEAALAITGNSIVCEGATEAYSIPAIVNATNYIWTLPAGATITSGAGTESVTVLFSSSGSGTIEVFGQNTCGTGSSNTLPVTINPLPDPAGAIAGNQNVCIGSTEIYTVGVIANTTGYTWTVPAGVSINSGQGTSTLNVTYTAAAVDGSITVVGTNACGSGTSSSLLIDVEPRPTVVLSASGPTIICNGESTTLQLDLTGTANWDYTYTNGTATVNGTATGTPFTITVSPATTRTYQITALEDANSCVSQATDISGTVTVNVTPRPTSTFSGTTTICEGESTDITINLSGQQPWDVTYTDGTTPVTISTNTTPYVFSVSPIADKSYWVTAVSDANSCDAIAADMTGIANITVNTLPSIFAVNETNGGHYCEGAAGVIIGLSNSEPAINNIDYQLYRDGVAVGAAVAGSGASFNFGIFTAEGFYTVIAENTGGTGCTQLMNGTREIVIDPYPADAQPITGNALVCPGATEVYIVPVIADANDYIWSWSNPGDATITAGVTSDTVYVQFSATAASGVLNVYGQNTCGDGVDQDLNVNLKPTLLASASITGDNVVCAGQTNITYTAAAVANATSYFWTVPAGASITSGQGSGSITVDYSNTASDGNVVVYGISDCMNGPTTSLAVTVNPIPNVTINAVTDDITCDPTSRVTLTAATTETNPITWLWTASNSGVIDGATNAITADASHEGDFQVQIGVTTSGLECYNAATTTVGADKVAPTVTIDPADDLTCTNLGSVTLQASATDVSYDWGPAANITSATNIANPTVDAAGNYTVTVTDVNNSCTASASVTVTDNRINPNVTVVSPSVDVLTCKPTEQTALLDGGSSTSNTTFLWTGPDPTITNATIEDATVDVAGVYTLTVTNTVNGCTDSKTVTVNEDVVVPGATITNVDTDHNDLTCINTEVDLKATVAAVPDATFAWSSGGGSFVISGTYDQYAKVDVAATYTVVATNPSNGCSSVAVNEDVAEDLSTAATTAINAAGSELTCTNSNTLSLNASIAGDAGGTYSWSGTGTLVAPLNTNTVDITSAGTYSLTYRHSVTGCPTTSADFVVSDQTATPSVTIDAGPYVITCADLNLKEAITPTLTATGDGQPTTTYLWTDPMGAIYLDNTALSTTVDKSGTYTITAENQYGCTASDNVAVSLNTTAPTITVIDPETEKITCTSSTVALSGSTSTGTATLLWSGGPVGATITNPTTTNPTVDLAGLYTLTVTDANNGCIATDNVTVSDNFDSPNITVTDPAADELTCDNSQVQLSTSTAVSGVTYAWTGPVGATITNVNPSDPWVDAVGTYSVTATHPTSGCTQTETIDVNNDNQQPTVNILPEALVITCTQSTINLDASSSTNATSFAWSTLNGNIVSGGPTNTAVISAAGTYDLVVTNGVTGCTETGQVIITENITTPNVNVTGGPYIITCIDPDPELSATADAGSSVFWTGPGTITNPTSLNPTVDAAGTYIITATAANGCTSTDNILVTNDNANPDITVDTNTDDITCDNSLVTVSGSSITPGVSYLWQVLSGGGNITSAASATTTVDAAGDYRLTVTAANGCSNTDVVTVGLNTMAPNIGLVTPDDNEITCNQTTVALNGSSTTTGAQFSWSTLIVGATITNGNSPTPTVDKTGDYTLTVTDPVNGCTSTANTTVNGSFTTPTINIAAPGTQITCSNPSIILDASGSTNATNYTWVASLGGHILSNGNTATPTVDAAGRYTVTAEHTITGCTASDFVDVTEDNSVPIIDVFDPAPGEVTCTNLTVTLSADATGLVANKDILWTTSDGNITAGANSSSPTVDQGGTYVVTITNTTTSCSTVRSVTIDENKTPPAITIDTPLEFTCSRAQVNLNATGTSADGSSVSYAWAAGAGGNIVSGAGNATAVVDAVADYTVTVTDLGNGCENSSTVSTSEDVTPPDVSVDTSPDQITCDNATVILNGSSTYLNVSYQWTTTGSGTIQNATTTTPIVNAAGTYNLIVTNTDNNCTAASSNVVVTENKLTPTVTVNAPSGDLTCSVSEVTISVSEIATYSYSWSGPGNITTPNSHSTNVDAVGTYTIIIEDINNGCPNSYTVDVSDDKVLGASPVINDIETCYGSANPSFNVLSGNNVKWYADAALTTYLTTGNSYTPLAATAGTHTYYATSTVTNGCESLPTEVVLTIYALPNSPVTIGNAICEGSAAEELTAVGSNINWYDNTSVLLASGSTYFPTDVLVESYTYYATQTDANSCESAQAEATYTINSIPAQPVFINPNIEICETGTNPTYTVVGDNIKWYKNMSGASVSTGNTYQPADVLPAVYSYYTTQTVSGCESPEATGIFTINAMPEVYNVQDGGSYCEGSGGAEITVSNSEVGVNYELWLDETSMISDVAGTVASISFGNQTLVGNYTAYAYNATSLCRIKMNGSVDVSIDPLPAAAPTIISSAEVCQNETGVSYSVPVIENATNYVWTVPSGFNIVSGNNSNSITVNVDNTATSGNVTVYAENSCGVGTTSPVFFVSVNPIPGPAQNLTGSSVICNGEDGVTFTVDADPDATYYNWTLPQGAIVTAGANSRQITLDFDQTAVNDVIIVAAANACGEGVAASQSITINDLPYVSAGDQQDLCVDNTVLDANTPASGTGTWSVFSGAVTLSGFNDPLATATNIGEGNNRLVWTVVDANGCSLSDTVLITNNTVIVEAGNNQIVCDESITLDGSKVPTGAIGSWSATTGSANFSDGNSSTAVASGFTSGINILRWTVSKGGCTSYDTLVIDNQRPTQAYAGIDLSICSDSSYLSANNPVTGSGLWTVVIGSATFENDTLYNTKISGLSKGQNVLRWTISNGICSTSDELTITNNKIVVDAGVDQIICDKTTTLDAIDLTSGSGYWSIESGSASFVDFEDPNSLVTGLSKGSNVLTWNVNNNSCISSDSVTITNDSPTTAFAGLDTTVTSDLITLQGNIPVVGIGSWSLISGSGIIDDPLLYNTTVSSLGPGDNKFRWTVTYNSCISTDDVIITNANAAPPNAGPDQTLCADETTLQGNDPLFGYGEWSVIQGSATFVDVSDPTTNVLSLAKGDNILKWSIWENGWSSDSVLISNDSPSDANAGLDQVLCADSAFLAGNNPIIGKGKWTVISGAGAFANDSLYNSKVTNLAKGENIFKWTISNRACSDEDIVIVRNDLPTIAEAGADAVSCLSTITLNPNTPSAGIGYWSVAQGSAYFEGNTAKNITRGVNVFVWTIENNACSYSDSIEITNYEPSDANAGADKVICVDTITLAANPAIYGAGIWTQESGSATFDMNDPTTKVTNLSQGLNVFKWTITYNGCIKSDRVTINNASVEAITGLDQEICSESTYLEANNPPAGSGMWSVLGGSGSATFTDINEPDTWVTGLDKGDNILRWTITNDICSDFADVTITNNLPTKAFAGPDQGLCADNSILQGNTPIYGTGEWSILSGSADIALLSDPSSIVNNLDYGVNTLRWTITQGSCKSTDEVVIANNSTITSNAGVDQQLCVDSAILYANIPAYGIGTWSVITGSATFEDNNDYNTKITNIGKGENTLRWVISNGGCSSTDEVMITNNAPTKSIAGADQTICGNSTYLQANIPTIGTGSWTLVSGAATFVTNTQNNTQVTELNPGSNTLRWTIENIGCQSFDDVVIYNDLPYVADAGADFEICSNTSPLYANDPVIGVGEWSVVSGSATFNDPSRFDATVTSLGFGANTLRWTIQYDACATFDEIVVTNNKIAVYAGVDQVITESSTLLAASNPSTGSGQWSVIGGSGGFEQPTNSITEVYGLGSGLNTFRWSVTINGCISSDDVSVTYNVPPVASFVVTSTEGCPPLDIYFVNNSLDGLPFTWDFDDGSSSDQITVKHTYTEPGIYKPSITIISETGDIIKKDTIITVFDQPEASFLVVNQQVYIPEEEAIFINTSTDALTYSWDFGDGGTSTESDPKYVYTEEGMFDIFLEVWSKNDCYDSITVANALEVIESGALQFPNAFTPNLSGPSGGYYNPNDFSNDVFYPIGDGVSEYHLEIFNKWGIIIFESKDINIGWDGYYKEKLVNEGVYVWKVTGKLNNEKDFKKVGTVILLR
jgi:hypothetical protein